MNRLAWKGNFDKGFQGDCVSVGWDYALGQAVLLQCAGSQQETDAHAADRAPAPCRALHSCDRARPGRRNLGSAPNKMLQIQPSLFTRRTHLTPCLQSSQFSASSIASGLVFQPPYRHRWLTPVSRIRHDRCAARQASSHNRVGAAGTLWTAGHLGPWARWCQQELKGVHALRLPKHSGGLLERQGW